MCQIDLFNTADFYINTWSVSRENLLCFSKHHFLGENSSALHLTTISTAMQNFGKKKFFNKGLQSIPSKLTKLTKYSIKLCCTNSSHFQFVLDREYYSKINEVLLQYFSLFQCTLKCHIKITPHPLHMQLYFFPKFSTQNILIPIIFY